MSHCKIFLILFSAISFIAKSQSVSISGTAEIFKNKEISLYTYEDFISYKENLLANAQIDNSGKFFLKMDLTSTQKAVLKIDNIAANIYLEPGKSYSINFPAPPRGKEVLGNLNFVNLKINNASNTELNSLIASFNQKYDKFIEENYALLVKKSAKQKVDEFISKSEKEYATVSDRFFRNFLLYSYAGLEQLSFSGKNKLYKKYLHNKPVLQMHPEYMNFFNGFYTNHLLLLSQNKKGADLTTLINTKKDLSGILDVLKADSILQNGEIRELVLIKGFKEIYHNEDFNKKSINYLLKQISEKSSYENNRKTAANVLYVLTKFNPGKKAPDFDLTDVNGNPVSLEQFKGKYIYLNFWASWCNSCINEMRMMNRLYDKYKNNIVFISVSTDKKITEFNNIVKKSAFPWIVAHYGTSKGIIDDYDARALPVFYLISPDGRFIEAPAQSPSENIEKKFQQLTSSPQKRIRVGEK